MTTTRPHRLSEVDDSTGLGTCSECGPNTRLRWRAHRSRWACRFADRRTQRKRVAGDHTAWRPQRLKRIFGMTVE